MSSLLDLVTIDSVLKVYTDKGYTLFEDDFDLNIFGVRNSDMVSETFNDVVGVLYKEKGEWKLFKTNGTTDAGLYYRENPMNVNGTGIIAPGQHKGAWKLGKHQGKYEALVQNNPILVYRDANRNNTLEYIGEPKPEMAGINLHRANEKMESKIVGKWSAACVVVANPNSFQQLLSLAKKQAELIGSTYTFTLFEQKDFV